MSRFEARLTSNGSWQVHCGNRQGFLEVASEARARAEVDRLNGIGRIVDDRGAFPQWVPVQDEALARQVQEALGRMVVHPGLCPPGELVPYWTLCFYESEPLRRLPGDLWEELQRLLRDALPREEPGVRVALFAWADAYREGGLYRPLLHGHLAAGPHFEIRGPVTPNTPETHRHWDALLREQARRLAAGEPHHLRYEGRGRGTTDRYVYQAPKPTPEEIR